MSPRDPMSRQGCPGVVGVRRSGKEIRSVPPRTVTYSKADRDWWQCEHCTYINKQVEFLSCEICGMIRFVPTLATASTSTAMATKRAAPAAAHDGWLMADHLLEPENRSEQVAGEQALHIEKVSQDREDEVLQALIRERMQEIVDRQRLLCTEILGKQGCRQSIPLHLESQTSIETSTETSATETSNDSSDTETSIDSVQDLLKNELSEPSELTMSQLRSSERKQPPRSSTSSTNFFATSPTARLQQSKNFSGSPTATVRSPPTMETRLLDGTTRMFKSCSGSPTESLSDQQLMESPRPDGTTRRSKSCSDSPAMIIEINPWEETAIGSQDILGFQEDLWDRLNNGERRTHRRRSTLGRTKTK